MEKLKEILAFMQENDTNGFWMDAIQDIKEGNGTIESELDHVLETMKRWKEEDKWNDHGMIERVQKTLGYE